MKKGFLKCAITLIILATAFAVRAQTGDDPNGTGNDTGTGRGIGGTINQGLQNIGSSVNTGVNNLGSSINSNLSKTKQTIRTQAGSMQYATNSLIAFLNAKFITGIPPAFTQSMKGNWQLIMANFSLSDINWLLTQKFTLAALTGVDIGQIVPGDNEVPTTTMKLAEIKSRVGQFNIGALLKTTSIQPQSVDERNALTLLQFVSGLNNSITALPKMVSVSGMGPIAAFQKQFGTYVAQQSVGLNVLYGLLSERLVKPGLGQQLGGPQKDMSPLGLDQYMATRRLNVNDPNGWLAQLSNATPAQIAKENLMLLAEMRYEMYLMRRTQEETNMLLATQQLQQTSVAAEKLAKLKSDVLSAGTGNILQ